MSPETVRAWQRILRDVVIVAVGAFMLIHETVTKDVPNPYIIAAGLTMLGLPPALRFDEWRRGGSDDNGKKD
jgi:hypothetical protein